MRHTIAQMLSSETSLSWETTPIDSTPANSPEQELFLEVWTDQGGTLVGQLRCGRSLPGPGPRTAANGHATADTPYNKVSRPFAINIDTTAAAARNGVAGGESAVFSAAPASGNGQDFPVDHFLCALSNRCLEKKACLVMNEIQGTSLQSTVGAKAQRP